MIESYLSRLLAMSAAGALAALAVMLLRLLLKKAPKIYAYALWGVVLLRLLCPVSIPSSVSLVPDLTVSPAIQARETGPDFMAANPARTEDVPRETDVPDPVSPSTLSPGPEAVPVAPARAPRTLSGWEVAGIIWLLGFAAMVFHGVWSLARLRRRLREAVLLRENIYLCDHIPGPFVIGVFRPKIYLPSDLSGAERGYILAHENTHIRRRDPLTRQLSYFALCLHWFNPLAWLAFSLSGKDMEMSCDEAVVKKLGADIRADYAASLLRSATGKSHFLAAPLAFGEGDPKGRIRNLGRWKKPALWVSIAAAAICVVGAVCLITTRPKQTPTLYLSSQSTQGLAQKAAYRFLHGSLGGTLTAEYWEEGELVSSSAPMTFSSEVDTLRFSVELAQENWQDHYLLIDMNAAKQGEDAVDASLTTSFPVTRTGDYLGWAFNLRRESEKLEVTPGASYILAAAYIDQGTGVEAYTPGDLEKDPERLNRAHKVVLLRVRFSEESAVALTAAVEKPEADAWTQLYFDGHPQGTLAVELWVDGACADRQAVEFSAVQRQIDLARYVFHERGGEIAYATGIGMDFGDGVSPKPDLYFPVPEGKTIETHAWNLREPGPIPAGEEVTLAAWYFDTGNGVTAYGCDALDRDPETAKGIEYGILVKLNLSREAKYLYDYVGAPGEVLPLEKVLGLAQKAKRLKWEDLEGYAYLDIGYGTRYQRYDTTGPFYLAVGGTDRNITNLDLYCTYDIPHSFDLLHSTGSLEEFIQRNLETAAVQETENWLRLQYAGDTGDIEVLSLRSLGVEGSWEEGRMTVYAQSLWERYNTLSGREERRAENVAAAFTVNAGGALIPELCETANLDSGSFVLTTRRLFPEEWLEEALSLKQSALPALEEENRKKLGEAQHASTRMDDLLFNICSSPKTSSNPGDYIREHEDEYFALAYPWPGFLDACYRRWCREGLGTDLETRVLASAWAQAWAEAGGDAWIAGQSAVPESISAFLRDFEGLAFGWESVRNFS